MDHEHAHCFSINGGRRRESQTISLGGHRSHLMLGEKESIFSGVKMGRSHSVNHAFRAKIYHLDLHDFRFNSILANDIIWGNFLIIRDRQIDHKTC